VCVCDRIVPFATARRVLVLQHPQEQDVLLGTAQLLEASLASVRLVVGLSWANLGHALGEESVDPKRWAVLFPARDARPNVVSTRAGERLAPSALEGLIVLDGTWSKAKTLWWRNPWLSKLNRLALAPTEPSIYGRLREEPRREYVSTLESVAGALTLCGESPDVERGLRRVFRTLVQRVRDANLPLEQRRRAKAPRPSRREAPRPTEPHEE
jgi:DTW domain-containing protein YfiP